MPKVIIARMGPVLSIQPLERRLISQIAEAHGGRTKSGDKDTITPLQTKTFLGNLQIRPRLLAATLRLADELAENPTRADPQALIKPYKPLESVIHNLYCRTIWVRTDYPANTIFLNYEVTRAELDEEFVLRPGEPILLVDYIRTRIGKCELERRYCTRFLYPALYDRLSVKLEIYDEDDNLLNSISLELADDGFAKLPTSITSRQPLLDGQLLRDKYHPKREETCA